MRKQRTAALLRLMDTCESMQIVWSLIGFGYMLAALYRNEASWSGQFLGLAILLHLGCFWSFYRTLRYEHEWLTRYDKPTKEK